MLFQTIHWYINFSRSIVFISGFVIFVKYENFNRNEDDETLGSINVEVITLRKTLRLFFCIRMTWTPAVTKKIESGEAKKSRKERSMLLCPWIRMLFWVTRFRYKRAISRFLSLFLVTSSQSYTPTLPLLVISFAVNVWTYSLSYSIVM